MEHFVDPMRHQCNLFLLIIALLGPVVDGVIAPFGLLLSLLELAHCSEVDGPFMYSHSRWLMCPAVTP